jgi:hypothetical protein
MATGPAFTEEETGWTGPNHPHPFIPPSNIYGSQYDESGSPSSPMAPFPNELPKCDGWESNSDARNSLLYTRASFLTPPESAHPSEGPSNRSHDSLTPHSPPSECRQLLLPPCTPARVAQPGAGGPQLSRPLWHYCSWIDPVTRQPCLHRDAKLMHLKQHEMAEHGLWRCRMTSAVTGEPCFLAFGQSSDLREHQRDTHPDQFICQMVDPKTNKPCGIKFYLLSQLDRHLRAVHDAERNVG